MTGRALGEGDRPGIPMEKAVEQTEQRITAAWLWGFLAQDELETRDNGFTDEQVQARGKKNQAQSELLGEWWRH